MGNGSCIFETKDGPIIKKRYSRISSVSQVTVTLYEEATWLTMNGGRGLHAVC